LDSNEPECGRLPSARLIPIAEQLSLDIGQGCLALETSGSLPQPVCAQRWPTPMTVNRTSRKAQVGRPTSGAQRGGASYGLEDAVLMSSAAASPARTSAWQARAQASTASAPASGPSTPELLAKFDPATSSWRTSQLCLDGALSEFSETWPRSGLMRNGTAYRLPPLVPLTAGTECGSWPTPTVDDSSNVTQQSGVYRSLTRKVMLRLQR
jgi:hypothetical protein